MKIEIRTNDPNLIKSTLWKAAARYRNQAKELADSGVKGAASVLERAAAELEEVAGAISILSSNRWMSEDQLAEDLAEIAADTI